MFLFVCFCLCLCFFVFVSLFFCLFVYFCFVFFCLLIFLNEEKLGSCYIIFVTSMFWWKHINPQFSNAVEWPALRSMKTCLKVENEFLIILDAAWCICYLYAFVYLPLTQKTWNSAVKKDVWPRNQRTCVSRKIEGQKPTCKRSCAVQRPG